jgi:hypothetical protein
MSGFIPGLLFILLWYGFLSNFYVDGGGIPEQILDDVNNPGYVRKWKNHWGGTALPLLWSYVMYLILSDILEDKC